MELHGVTKEGFIISDLARSNTTEFSWDDDTTEIKLILRPFTDMKEEDLLEIMKISNPGSTASKSEIGAGVLDYLKNGKSLMSFDGLDADQIFQLTKMFLDRGFDLFGLIPAGLAIDKTTLK